MLQNLALDRTIEIGKAFGEQFIEDPSFDPKTFFDDVIGVTKTMRDKPQTIVFRAIPEQVPYIHNDKAGSAESTNIYKPLFFDVPVNGYLKRMVHHIE